MAEIELSALSKQCLDRRIGDIDTLTKETSMWAQERNIKKSYYKMEIHKKRCKVKAEQALYKVAKLMLWCTSPFPAEYVFLLNVVQSLPGQLPCHHPNHSS